MHKANINTDGWFWKAPDYFSKWRVFPRIFISVYIFMVYSTSEWFMALADPTTAQAGFVSVIVGAGAAWFGLYVNSGSSSERAQIVVNTVTPRRADEFNEAEG